MARNNSRRDAIPKEFASIEEAAEFWETHDLTAYEDIWHEVEFHVNLRRPSHARVNLEPEIADEFAKRARAKKTTLDSSVNDALREYLRRGATR